ncbi:MAG: isoamylase early set domain-containing protein [Treponema sp.]|nr:isoamylase early set domain-containing protein [Treponema sp.]
MSLSKSFSADGKKCTVTFSVNPNAAAGAEKVFLVGEFNSWNETATPMKKMPDGSFSVKKQLETNKKYQFRYLLNGKDWINDWKADEYIRSELANDDNSCVDTTVPAAVKTAKKPASKSAAKTTAKKSSTKGTETTEPKATTKKSTAKKATKK